METSFRSSSMDFYCGVFRDFVVPKDQDLLDSIPSPDSWSKWGMSSSDSFSSFKKVFSLEAKTTMGDSDGRSFNRDTELERSFHDKPQSGGSSWKRGLSETSFNQRVVSYDQNNHQLQDLGAFEATDDYFLNSILDYPSPGAVNQGKYFSGSQFGKSCCGTPIADVTRESSSDAYDVCNMEVSQYAKPLHFNLLGDCSAKFSSKERSFPSKEGEPVENLAKIGLESRYQYSCEDFSLEAYILQELEMAISQFTEKTRICFRDALYRLARNSNQQHTEDYQDDEWIPLEGQTSRTDPMRSIRDGEVVQTQAKELETNTIDRAIATLMFDKMDFNLQNISVATSANSEQQMMTTATVPGSSFSSTQMQNFQSLPNSQGALEVPRFSHMDQDRGLNQNGAGRSHFMLNFASVT